jgi:hypothetical protein
MSLTKVVRAAVICVLLSPAIARADVVLDWNVIAVNTAIANGQSPFAQARFAAITQLAVFEAVNAVTGDYEPYLLTDGHPTIVAPAGASADAAAVAAAYRVLWTYFSSNPATATALNDARASSLAAIPAGQSKDDGIATGEAAAAAMTALRANDGSAPAAFYEPGPTTTGLWQATPSCPINPATGLRRGVLAQWGSMTPFGLSAAAAFIPEGPPSINSTRYLKDYNEVMTVGGMNSTARPQDRADVARFYAAASPAYLLNSVARQLSIARGDTMSENARALALINMASSDGLVVSFATKYTYILWRPETAIRAADTDGNPKTVADSTFVPFITTPCFPSYPSNHASGTNSGLEALRRLYGAAGHAITMTHPGVPGVTFEYTALKQLSDDVDDARVYGGIHFRFDQEAGGRLGREVATYVFKHNLRRVNGTE